MAFRQQRAVAGVGGLPGLVGGLAGIFGDVLAVALAAQRVLEGGVVVGVVALGPGIGGVVVDALPLGQGVGCGGGVPAGTFYRRRFEALASAGPLKIIRTTPSRNALARQVKTACLLGCLLSLNTERDGA